jgi:signal transduction histidine kinase
MKAQAEENTIIQRSRYIRIIHNPYTAWIVLSVSLVLTLSAAMVSYYYSRKIAEERFLFRSDEIADAIRYRLTFYEQALWGGVGLFNSSKEVSRKEFREYVRSLTIYEHLPGIQGIGYSIPVSKADKEAHIQRIREEGFPEYVIKPETERDEYSAIIYLEPFDWRNQRAFGYDMWSNEMRREAMSRARDMGVAANSGIITLVQETSKDVQRGFLMYLPVYEKGMPFNTVESRRKWLQGWIYSPFRAGDLMKGIMRATNTEYNFEVYDGYEIKEESLLFDSDSVHHLLGHQKEPDFSRIIDLELQGRAWKLYVHSTPSILTAQERRLPLLIGIVGFLIDLLLFFLIVSLNRLQVKTQNMARRLEKQKEDLEYLNEDLSQFAYITSHDLQEPLRTVTNYAKLLQEDYKEQFDEEGKHFLKTIIGATKRMSELIHAVLRYSRLGRVDHYSDSVDCNVLIEDIREDLEGLFTENDVQFSWEPLPVIEGNKAMIKQLFSNLISNAVKYRKADVSPVIRITAVSGQSLHEFSIEDNGIGIEKKYLDKIFQIFQRLHNKTKYSGTGIGLASSKKIVELHKGSIHVRSEVGKGSVFTFTISK